MLIDSRDLAAAFEQQGIPPHAPEFPDAFTATHFAKTTSAMQLDRRGVFRKHRSLKRPDAVLLRFANQSFHQRATYTFATTITGYVNTDFGYARINLTARDKSESRPSQDALSFACNQSSESMVACVPVLPRRRFCLESGVAGGHTFEIN